MKKRLTILTAALLLAACGKEKVTTTGTPTPVAVSQERDIFYTVAEKASLAIIAGNDTSVHLATEAEWDDLLDQFCDRASEGNQVVFRPCKPQTANNKKDTPTSISTSDRDEMKAWMKEMEKGGMTVIVTYDDNTGRWNGTAYTSLAPAAAQAVVQDYSGELTFIPTPAVQDASLGGLVWALQVNDDSTLVVTVDGMMLWFDCETPDEAMAMLTGPATLRGTAGTHNDSDGGTFMTLDLELSDDGVITF